MNSDILKVFFIVLLVVLPVTWALGDDSVAEENIRVAEAFLSAHHAALERGSTAEAQVYLEWHHRALERSEEYLRKTQKRLL